MLIETSNNKPIYVYDDLFDYATRLHFYNFIINSVFAIKGSDLPFKKDKQFFSIYNDLELSLFGFTDTKAYAHLNEVHNLESAVLKMVRVNLSTNSEHNVPHCDHIAPVYNPMVGITLIYYANLQWDISWGGQTLFLNEKLDEVVYCSLFKPGRVILFDNTIPHMILTPTTHAVEHRFSFVMQFENIPN